MNFLPAFYFPTTLVCVDDKELVLSGYKRLFHDKFRCVVFNDPGLAKQFFDSYESILTKINFLSHASDLEEEKFMTQSTFQFDIAKILELVNYPNKDREVSVLLSDFYMLPNMDGLQLCKAIASPSIQKMLLTENQTYNTAREALNSGIIDYFANKTDPVIETKGVVVDLATKFFCKLTANLVKSLEAANTTSPLTDQIFINYFKKIITDKSILEYYLIDRNGSFLLIDKDKQKYVLIVHNYQSISDFTAILEEYVELQDQLQLVKQGKLIPFFGIGREMDPASLARIGDYLFKAEELNAKQQYYISLAKI